MKNIRFTELLNIDPQKYKKIAVVGGGGKTSLIFRLTEELKESGKKVIVTTTTHMASEPDRPYAEAGDWEKLKFNIDNFGYTVTAVVDAQKGKTAAPPQKILDKLQENCDVLLIEADGAKRLPLKVPETWEPVIPDWTDLVIGVMGLDSLGRSIQETAHRPWNVAAFLGKREEDFVEPDDLMKIAVSEAGLRKNVNKRDYRVYFNKLDALKNPQTAEELCRELKIQGIYAVFGQLK